MAVHTYMHTKSDLEPSHVVDLSGECQASESVDRGVGDPEPLLVVVLDRESNEGVMRRSLDLPRRRR